MLTDEQKQEIIRQRLDNIARLQYAEDRYQFEKDIEAAQMDNVEDLTQLHAEISERILAKVVSSGKDELMR